MLEKWLEVDKDASWAKLFTAIESKAVVYVLNHDEMLPHPQGYVTGMSSYCVSCILGQ